MQTGAVVAVLLFLGVPAPGAAGAPRSGAPGEPPGVEVEVRSPAEPTGTMHYVEQLAIRIGSARPLVLGGEDGFAPIPGPSFRLGGHRYLLLCWSSTGAGLQTLHALSLGVRDGGVVLADELRVRTDRPSAGLVARAEKGAGLRIGLPEPPAGFVHSADEWALEAGQGGPIDLARIRGLAFEPVRRRAADVLYTPPAGRAPFPRRVAWISIDAGGRFVLPPRGRTPESLLRALYASHEPWRGEDLLDGVGPGEEDPLARYLDGSLLRLLRSDDDCRRRTGGVGLLDFDPFLDAQDYDDAGLSRLAFEASSSRGTARCVVSFLLFSGEPQSARRLVYELVRTADGWRIRDVDYGKGRTLARILSGRCE